VTKVVLFSIYTNRYFYFILFLEDRNRTGFSRRGVGEFNRIKDACSYGFIDYEPGPAYFYREEKEKRRGFVFDSSFRFSRRGTQTGAEND
jgi:hypothetical protein